MFLACSPNIAGQNPARTQRRCSRSGNSWRTVLRSCLRLHLLLPLGAHPASLLRLDTFATELSPGPRVVHPKVFLMQSSSQTSASLLHPIPMEDNRLMQQEESEKLDV